MTTVAPNGLEIFGRQAFDDVEVAAIAAAQIVEERAGFRIGLIARRFTVKATRKETRRRWRSGRSWV